jgi:hypothetical protein
LSVTLNIEAQEISGWSRVWVPKFGIQLLLEVIQGLPAVVDDEFGRPPEPRVRGNLLLCSGSSHRDPPEKGWDPGTWAIYQGLVQAPRRLLETVEGLPQKKDLVCSNIATFRWREVDCFLKIAIEENRFDVDLIEFQIEVIDQRDEDPDGVSVGNLCK